MRSQGLKIEAVQWSVVCSNIQYSSGEYGIFQVLVFFVFHLRLKQILVRHLTMLYMYCSAHKLSLIYNTTIVHENKAPS